MERLNIIFMSLPLSLFLFFCDAPKAGKQDGKKSKNKEVPSPGIKVLNKSELPGILKEVSGIAYLTDNRFASVQDEAGAIFIYNTADSKLEKQVSFGAAGDYEGLALVDKNAYVVRSDGQLFEVNNFESSSPKINEYTTGLTAKNNVEGLTYDPKNNRLLLAIKGSETEDTDYKGIYAFDLNTKKLSKTPVYKIDLTDAVFKNNNSKKISGAINPSEIGINPVTGDIYITEATNPQLLILDSSGNIKKRYKLDESEFSQPEGITFSPSGKLFIANEGAKKEGNILEVEVSGL